MPFSVVSVLAIERVCSGMCPWFGVAVVETEGSTVVILGPGAANGESVLNGDRVPAGDDEKVLETEGGDGCPAVWMVFMLLNRTLKNS